MRLTHYLYMVPLALLAACNSDEELAVADRAGSEQIVLSASIAEGNLQTVTRGSSATDTYQALTKDTKITLQVSGTWTGHDPSAVVKTTIATAASPAATTNNLTTAPVLYWDDFGSADTGNADTGRKEGLTIYGVAVDGQTTALSVSDWSALSWDVNSNQTAGWTTKDLLISNNVKGENTYKFDARTAGKQLEFRHALSKITVNLKAGDGFEDSKFVSAPTVTLLDWAHTDGTVNVTTGEVSLGSATGVTMYQATTATTDYNVTKEALVMPGSAFKKGADIIKLNADGNIYYVSSEKIRTAINSAAHDTDDLTKAGKNYIINVVVNKTDIIVTATVVDWVDVNSEEVHPVINVTTEIKGGTDKPAGDNTFAFWRSETIDKNYVNAAKPDMKADGTVDWTHTTTLYWSSHNQHYHFRGIYPATTTVVTDATDQTQYVEVTNGDYDATSFPSNFLLGMPEIAEGTMCDNDDHEHKDMSIYGICAREAAINLNFRYMMSQVEVVMTSSAVDAKDHVDLTHVQVDLVKVYKNGHVLLKDRSVVPSNIGTFTLTQVDTDNHQYLGVVVPQELTYTTSGAETNLRFKITVTNSDNTKDIYYADIQPIKVKEQNSSEALATVDAWESGKHYIYNLKVTKTEIKTSVSLTDWITYEASQDVWF